MGFPISVFKTYGFDFKLFLVNVMKKLQFGLDAMYTQIMTQDTYHHCESWHTTDQEQIMPYNLHQCNPVH